MRSWGFARLFVAAWSAKRRPHETGRPLVAHIPRQCCDLKSNLADWVFPKYFSMTTVILPLIVLSFGSYNAVSFITFIPLADEWGIGLVQKAPLPSCASWPSYWWSWLGHIFWSTRLEGLVTCLKPQNLLEKSTGTQWKDLWKFVHWCIIWLRGGCSCVVELCITFPTATSLSFTSPM